METMREAQGSRKRFYISFAPGGKNSAGGLYFTFRKALEIVTRLNAVSATSEPHGPVYFVVRKNVGSTFNQLGRMLYDGKS